MTSNASARLKPFYEDRSTKAEDLVGLRGREGTQRPKDQLLAQHNLSRYARLRFRVLAELHHSLPRPQGSPAQQLRTFEFNCAAIDFAWELAAERWRAERREAA